MSGVNTVYVNTKDTYRMAPKCDSLYYIITSTDIDISLQYITSTDQFL